MTDAADTPPLLSGAPKKDLKPDDGKIEIRIGNAPLDKKLAAVGAVIDAIRQAHGDTMSPRSWAAMERAQAALVDAMLSINDRRPTELPDPVRRIRGVGR